MQHNGLITIGRMGDIMFNNTKIQQILIAIVIALLPALITRNLFFNNTVAIGHFFSVEYISRIIAIIYLDIRVINKLN